MSIINEALKKAQKERGDTTPSSPSPAARNLEVQIEKRRNAFNWGPVVVVLVLILIGAPVLAPALSVPFRRSEVPALPAEARQIAAGQTIALERGVQLASVPAEETGTRRGQFGIEEAPRMPALYPRPNLALTGVMVSGRNDSYCILNDRVVKVGESVQGARLTRVTPDTVELEFQGERIVLPVKEA